MNGRLGEAGQDRVVSALDKGALGPVKIGLEGWGSGVVRRSA